MNTNNNDIPPPPTPPTPQVEEEMMASPPPPEQQEDEAEGPPPPPIDCGILSRYPVGAVLTFAAIGVGAGVGLSVWEPDDPEAKEIALQWVGLIGDLFLRGLQAVVLPLVVVNVILAIVDMMSNGTTGSVAGKMIGFYILTGALASCVALLYIITFQGLFQEGDFEEPAPPEPSTVLLGCGGTGTYLAHGGNSVNGSRVACVPNATEANTAFTVHEINTGDGTMDSTNSLSDTIYLGVFQRLVTSNIVGSFIEANFAALVVFCVFFGIALAKTVILPQRSRGEESVVVHLLGELDKVFSLLIFWVLSVTPFAVMSLLAATIGAQNDLLEAFQNIALLMVTVLLAMATHFVLVYGGLFLVITQCNPASYFYNLLPAQSTVFATASSVATIPVTVECVNKTEKVPPAVSRLVVPLGAAINLDGGAIYFPIACVWLAVLNGLEVSAGDYVLLIILATVGSAGTASVPAASLVLIISAYNTVFGTTGAPYGFSFILAMDWFLDRCRATLNVTGDAVVCALVTKVQGISAMEEEKATESSISEGMDDGLSEIAEEKSGMMDSEVASGEMEDGTPSIAVKTVVSGQNPMDASNMSRSSKNSRTASSRLLATLAMDTYGQTSFREMPNCPPPPQSLDQSARSLGRSARSLGYSQRSSARFNRRNSIGSVGSTSHAVGQHERRKPRMSASTRMMNALAMETYSSARNIMETNPYAGGEKSTDFDDIPSSQVNKHSMS